MARPELVDDGLWELMKTLLADRTPQQTGRPSQRPDRAFTAIVFVMVTGVLWLMVPRAYLVNPFFLSAREFPLYLECLGRSLRAPYRNLECI
jgi:hypothetical protein